jgi:prepilin-type N-terminal cleavage/methylation domain-containing protein
MKRLIRWRTAFTLIELLVVIAIIAILAAILFPVFAQARDKARATACLSQAKQIGTAVYMYVQDYDETYYWQSAWDECDNWGAGSWGPQYWSYTRWPIRHLPYIKNQGVFRCPSDKDPLRGTDPDGLTASGPDCGIGGTAFPVSFGGNLGIFEREAGPTAMAAVTRPAQKIVVAEALVPYGFEPWNVEYFRGANYTFSEDPYRPFSTFRRRVGCAQTLGEQDSDMAKVTRHQLGDIAIFCDGHAKWLRWNQMGDSDTGRCGAVSANRLQWRMFCVPDYE